MRIHLCVDLSSITLMALKCKMLCIEQLTAKLCPVFTQSDLHIKHTLVSHFFQQITKILDMFLAWKMMTYRCPTWRSQKRMSLVVMQGNVFSRSTMTKEYFSISYLPNFFLTVQNECISLCLNGMSKAAILRSNTVHFFGALVHQSALLLVFQRTSAANTK